MQPQVLFEDNSIIVVDKPAGMIVHDGEESLSAWFRRHSPEIDRYQWPDPDRAGIVHRLDQGTSGAIVLAKTPAALEKLQEEFHNHKIKKVYWTLVYGYPDPEQGTIDVAIGRHPSRKTPMSVVPVAEVARGKVRPASTDYKVLEIFKDAALVEVTMHTGRTHQIRLHMKYIGHPILGDEIYGTKPSRHLSKTLSITRQILHAKTLGFPHPKTGEWMEFPSHIPSDFEQTIHSLR